ncbi:cellulase-like family protein [Microbacterium plantarum]|uniref:cellulase-like family protein n=1 Tax=Microbacterium plantarum TaxID=1816425 RepID=UPI002B4936E8|nr:cellulase-like family protein [Microbacterium plantarum]WRK16215.1 cellulase-like family protein [Microbacterium plantarum]
MTTPAPYVPVPIPAHLPEKLTITLWDFSWYVRTGAGEPFEDLDAAAADAVARGYNTVRICAMPFLLFGTDIDTSDLELDRLGGDYAQNVRWYDVASPTRIDARAHLLELFRVLKRHDMFVILSSWEYQQSSVFATHPAWWEALIAVAPEDRPLRLAESLADLVSFVAAEGLDDRIAFTELHNEVQAGYLGEGLPDAATEPDAAIAALTPRLDRGLAAFHARHPAHPVTVNYAGVPVAAMRTLPREMDVLVTHPYVYGVLDEITAAFDLRGSLADFPVEAVRAAGLLRADAPEPTSWVLPDEVAWKMQATIVGKPEIYLMDWVDAAAFDRFLYERYQVHHHEMVLKLSLWLDVAADRAAERGIPTVFGEGWVGYTPLHGAFEEGPIGAQFCRLAMAESARIGAWGTIVCSNAAPHHPMWRDVALQRECNEGFLASAGV